MQLWSSRQFRCSSGTPPSIPLDIGSPTIQGLLDSKNKNETAPFHGLLWENVRNLGSDVIAVVRLWSSQRKQIQREDFVFWQRFLRPGASREVRPGEHGLDQTHTCASTYWGGALFCLMADVSIREKTGNQKGLQDALRGFVNSGGSIADDWPISKVITVGDRATETSVLADFYRRMGDAPYAPIDLTPLWKRLGIHSDRGKITSDDNAPLAPIRQAITSPG